MRTKLSSLQSTPSPTYRAMINDPSLIDNASQLSAQEFKVGSNADSPSTVDNAKSTTKVLHIINGEHYSGAERVQDLLAKCLPEFNYEVGFACLKTDKFPEKRDYQAAPVFDCRMKNQYDLMIAKRISSVIKDENYKIIHAHTPRSVMLARICAQLTGLPFIYHVHSPTSRDSTRVVTNWLNQKVENWSIRRAAAMITVSNSLAEHVMELGIEKQYVHVVPNGVPIQPRMPFQTTQGQFTIGTVALIRPRKGVEILLQALAVLRKKGHNVVMNAVGPFETNEYKTQLLAMAKSLGVAKAVRWIGFTKEVNAELLKMDTFVLPSLFGEGLPMVVLEAMACGVPIVATDVEGTPEAVRHLKDGLIAKSGNAEDLAEKLELFASGKINPKTMGEVARRRQVSHFSDRSMAEGVSKVYDTIQS